MNAEKKRFVVQGEYFSYDLNALKTISVGECEFSDIAKELRDIVVTHGEGLWKQVWVLDRDTGERLHPWVCRRE